MPAAAGMTAFNSTPLPSVNDFAVALGACSMVRNNMLVKTAVTGSPQRRNAKRPGGRSAGGRAALGGLLSLTLHRFFEYVWADFRGAVIGARCIGTSGRVREE